MAKRQHEAFVDIELNFDATRILPEFSELRCYLVIPEEVSWQRRWKTTVKPIKHCRSYGKIATVPKAGLMNHQTQKVVLAKGDRKGGEQFMETCGACGGRYWPGDRESHLAYDCLSSPYRITDRPANAKLLVWPCVGRENRDNSNCFIDSFKTLPAQFKLRFMPQLPLITTAVHAAILLALLRSTSQSCQLRAKYLR